MPSKVDIANRALDLLGQRTITVLGSAEVGSGLMDRLFTSCFQEVARSVPFRCLTTRDNIAASTAAPAWGYDYAYPLPANCLAVLDVYVGDTRLGDWMLEGESLLCDEEGPLQIRYTRTSDDPNEWDVLLQSAVAYRLAIEACESFTTSGEKLSGLTARYRAIVAQAASRSAKESTPRAHSEADSWELARYAIRGTSGR